MHIFLTGEKQVGKSTIIRSYLLDSGHSADGFITYWDEENEGERRLFLSPYCPDRRPDGRFLIARQSGQRMMFQEDITQVFDVHGCELLDRAGRCDFIVMDELGFLESDAASFQESVLQRISGAIPILGVIKPARTAFLDAVRAHPNVQIKEVTVENREDVLAWLKESRPG